MKEVSSGLEIADWAGAAQQWQLPLVLHFCGPMQQ
jgi:hypothetical protein